MKLFVRENQNLAETEVEIRCRERDGEVENLISAINSASNVVIGEKESGDKVPVYLIFLEKTGYSMQFCF